LQHPFEFPHGCAPLVLWTLRLAPGCTFCFGLIAAEQALELVPLSIHVTPS
jgi:hypothetical protein